MSEIEFNASSPADVLHPLCTLIQHTMLLESAFLTAQQLPSWSINDRIGSRDEGVYNVGTYDSSHQGIDCRRPLIRTGKTRKVKCDEKRPECTRCQVRKEVCSLSESIDITSHAPSGFPPATAMSNTSVTTNTSPQSSGSQFYTPPEDKQTPVSSASSSSPMSLRTVVTSPALPVSTYPDINRLPPSFRFYFEHFITTTAPTLSFTEDGLRVWRDYVPDLALRNQYLLHVLVEISACHKAYLCSANNDMEGFNHHFSLAGEYQNQAIKLYIPELSKSSVDTCTALLSFNLLLSCMAYAWQSVLARAPDRASIQEHEAWWVDSSSESESDEAHLQSNHDRRTVQAFRFTTLKPITNQSNVSIHSPTNQPLRPVYYLAEFFRGQEVWRGTEAIAQQYWNNILASPMKSLIRHQWNDMRPIPTEARASLDMLRRWTDRLATRAAERKSPKLLERVAMYNDVLTKIENYVRLACDDGEENKASITQWPASLSKDFSARMKKRDRIAVGLVGVWAGCLEACGRGRWWAEGYARGLGVEVSELIVGQGDDVVESEEGRLVCRWMREVMGLDTG